MGVRLVKWGSESNSDPQLNNVRLSPSFIFLNSLTASRYVTKFLESSEFNLFVKVWINTSENVTENCTSTMPNVAKEE